jgi:hypothetical protein
MPRATLARFQHILIFSALRYPSIAAAPMKRILASVLTTILIVAMTLAAMFTLVRATVYVTSIESSLQRAIAIAAELLLGVVLLLGTVWLATHLAVRIFGVKEPAPPGGPVA